MKHAITMAIIFTMGLSACASADGEFPSLEKRPFEGILTQQQTEIKEYLMASTLPPALAEKVQSLQQRHSASQRAYADILPSARAAARAAAGSSAGNENWVSAHVKLSRLDQARADSVSALAAMDELVTKQRDIESAGGTASLLALLTPAQSGLAAAVDTQNAEIQKLSLLIGL